MKRDIETKEDIQTMVDTFYTKVREDDLIGRFFTERIEDRWPIHLDIMYRFWGSILLGENTYDGRPFPKHASMPLEQEHFARWLYLFHSTVDSLFVGVNANEAKKRAAQIAAVFYSKIQMIRC